MTPEPHSPSAVDEEETSGPRRYALNSATPINLALTVALVVLLFISIRHDFGIGDPATVLLLTAAAWTSESFAAVVQRFSSISLVSTLIGVAVVLCGPIGASLVGVSCGFCLGRWPLPVRMFNGLMSAVMGAIGGLAFTWLIGVDVDRLDWVRHHIDTLVVPVSVVTLVMLLFNALLLSLVIRVTAGVPFSRSLRDFGDQGVRLFLAGGLISYLMVVLWVGAHVGPFTILVMAPPLLLVQWAWSSAEAEASSADHAVDAMVASLELNRPGSRAHGELVALLAEEIGNLCGLSDDQVHQVRRAARLHHLGTMTSTDEGPVPITAAVAQSGAQLLDGVEFLAPARKIIAAQSEWMHKPASPATVLAAADLLAGCLESSCRADGPQWTRGHVEQCMGEVAARPELDPTVRGAIASLQGTTLPDRLTTHPGAAHAASARGSDLS